MEAVVTKNALVAIFLDEDACGGGRIDGSEYCFAAARTTYFSYVSRLSDLIQRQ
jgi:hypothetical protein